MNTKRRRTSKTVPTIVCQIHHPPLKHPGQPRLSSKMMKTMKTMEICEPARARANAFNRQHLKRGLRREAVYPRTVTR
jgi:hypothetical protein